jgi:hypothetical protein
MTSTVKVNNVQASDGGNIINQCGTNITIGASGDTIALASGASQTGFGRTGTVNWDTTKKTAGFTGVSGNGYFIDTSAGAITVNLPASPSAGDIMALADYAGTAGTNAITVGRNGSNIEGIAEDGKISENRESKTLVFVDATQGWLPVNDNFESIAQAKFVAATGGTISTVCTNFKVHTFTGPGTFCVSCAGNSLGANTISYMVIAGGGGGAQNYGAGGGAGGFRESKSPSCGYTSSPIAATGGLPDPVTVGAGGAAPNCAPASGSNSVFAGSSTITSAGGGRAGGNANPAPTYFQGANGGSGGGSRGGLSGGSGNTPSTTPSQGFPGGPSSACTTAGGGGGATAAGTTGTPSAGGNGGAGATTCISGSSVTRAGGGAAFGNAPTVGSAGPGGGGAGTGPASDKAGDANTGGGGGSGCNPAPQGGAGGSGIVIIRYKFQ